MKNIINKLKKGFGISYEQPPADTTETPVEKEPTSFIPATTIKRDAIIAFIVQSLKPYVDERTVSVAGLRLYIVCNNTEQEEAAQVALCADRPGMFQSSSFSGISQCPAGLHDARFLINDRQAFQGNY